MGLEGSNISWEKNRLLRGNFPSKFPRPKFPGDNRKFYEEILGSLDNRTEISTLSQYWMMPTTYLVHTTASSHTNVAPRALTNVRGRTAVLAGMMIDVFCFQSGHVT